MATPTLFFSDLVKKQGIIIYVSETNFSLSFFKLREFHDLDNLFHSGSSFQKELDHNTIILLKTDNFIVYVSQIPNINILLSCLC